MEQFSSMNNQLIDNTDPRYDQVVNSCYEKVMKLRQELKIYEPSEGIRSLWVRMERLCIDKAWEFETAVKHVEKTRESNVILSEELESCQQQLGETKEKYNLLLKESSNLQMLSNQNSGNHLSQQHNSVEKQQQAVPKSINGKSKDILSVTEELQQLYTSNFKYKDDIERYKTEISLLKAQGKQDSNQDLLNETVEQNKQLRETIKRNEFQIQGMERTLKIKEDEIQLGKRNQTTGKLQQFNSVIQASPASNKKQQKGTSVVQLEKQQKEIEQVKLKLRSKEKEAEQLKAQLQLQRIQTAQQNKNIAQKDRTIQELQNQFVGQEQQDIQVQQNIQDLQKEKASLQASLKKLDEENCQLRAFIDNLNDQQQQSEFSKSDSAQVERINQFQDFLKYRQPQNFQNMDQRQKQQSIMQINYGMPPSKLLFNDNQQQGFRPTQFYGLHLSQQFAPEHSSPVLNQMQRKPQSQPQAQYLNTQNFYLQQANNNQLGSRQYPQKVLYQQNHVQASRYQLGQIQQNHTFDNSKNKSTTVLSNEQTQYINQNIPNYNNHFNSQEALSQEVPNQQFIQFPGEQYKSRLQPMQLNQQNSNMYQDNSNPQMLTIHQDQPFKTLQDNNQFQKQIQQQQSRQEDLISTQHNQSPFQNYGVNNQNSLVRQTNINQHKRQEDLQNKTQEHYMKPQKKQSSNNKFKFQDENQNKQQGSYKLDSTQQVQEKKYLANQMPWVRHVNQDSVSSKQNRILQHKFMQDCQDPNYNINTEISQDKNRLSITQTLQDQKLSQNFQYQQSPGQQQFGNTYGSEQHQYNYAQSGRNQGIEYNLRQKNNIYDKDHLNSSDNQPDNVHNRKSNSNFQSNSEYSQDFDEDVENISAEQNLKQQLQQNINHIQALSQNKLQKQQQKIDGNTKIRSAECQRYDQDNEKLSAEQLFKRKFNYISQSMHSSRLQRSSFANIDVTFSQNLDQVHQANEFLNPNTSTYYPNMQSPVPQQQVENGANLNSGIVQQNKDRSSVVGTSDDLQMQEFTQVYPDVSYGKDENYTNDVNVSKNMQLMELYDRRDSFTKNLGPLAKSNSSQIEDFKIQDSHKNLLRESSTHNTQVSKSLQNLDEFQYELQKLPQLQDQKIQQAKLRKDASYMTPVITQSPKQQTKSFDNETELQENFDPQSNQLYYSTAQSQLLQSKSQFTKQNSDPNQSKIYNDVNQNESHLGPLLQSNSDMHNIKQTWMPRYSQYDINQQRLSNINQSMCDVVLLESPSARKSSMNYRL